MCGYEPAAHHRLLIEKLEAIVLGTAEHRKLIVCLPPGSAKSTYISKLFPAWFLAQTPTSRCILACSYSYDLISGFGRSARNLIAQHSRILGISLSGDTRAAGEWETAQGGRYFCAGTGAGIAGHRADLAFIDDPIGTEEDARSKTYREKLWNWYLNDFFPRLKPNGSQIVIANRRHEDDLVGMLLAQQPGEWEVINLPFFAEENDPLGRSPDDRLWPEWFTEEMAAAVRKLPPSTLAGLYQQRPNPESGEFFQKEWLIGYEPKDLPKNLTIYAASDHAIAEEEKNDNSCFLLGGICEKGFLWILPDCCWKKMGSDVQVNEMFKLVKEHRPLVWWAGKDHIEAAIGPFLRKRMLEENVYARLQSIPPGRKDKRVRAHSIYGRMAQGMVRFPTFAPWWAKAEHEILTFDNGKHDDFVDAIAVLGQGLDRMFAPSPLVEPKEQPLSKVWHPTIRWIKHSHKCRERDRFRALSLCNR